MTAGIQPGSATADEIRAALSWWQRLLVRLGMGAATLPRSYNRSDDPDVLALREEVTQRAFPAAAGGPPEPSEVETRMVLDGVATPEECRALVEWARGRVVDGDAYGTPHPHRPDELWSGVGLQDPRLTAEEKALPLELVRRVRARIMTYFALPELWIGLAHLARRRALEAGEADPEGALSHPWHQDDKGDKWWRTHSAVLYLNDDFEGGCFLFKQGSVLLPGPARRIQPCVGRLVAFTGGIENLHAVERLRRGERYSLAMWFSTSPVRRAYHERLLGPSAGAGRG